MSTKFTRWVFADNITFKACYLIAKIISGFFSLIDDATGLQLSFRPQPTFTLVADDAHVDGNGNVAYDWLIDILAGVNHIAVDITALTVSDKVVIVLPTGMPTADYSVTVLKDGSSSCSFIYLTTDGTLDMDGKVDFGFSGLDGWTIRANHRHGGNFFIEYGSVEDTNGRAKRLPAIGWGDQGTQDFVSLMGLNDDAGMKRGQVLPYPHTMEADRTIISDGVGGYGPGWAFNDVSYEGVKGVGSGLDISANTTVDNIRSLFRVLGNYLVTFNFLNDGQVYRLIDMTGSGFQLTLNKTAIYGGASYAPTTVITIASAQYDLIEVLTLDPSTVKIFKRS
jgi:hypothetical protein